MPLPTTEADAAHLLTLTDLLVAWRHRWPTLVIGLVAGAVLAATAHRAISTSYEAVTVVQVESAEPQLVDMAVEEAVATSRRVTGEALDTLGDASLTIDRLEAAASVRAIGSSHVLHVAFSAPTPGAAALGADALAQAYLAARAVDAAADQAPTARPTGRIVDPARTPIRPSGLPAAAWCLAGSVLGLGIAAPVAARPLRHRPTARRQAARAS